MHILHPRLCNKSVQNVVSPWVRVFGGVTEAFGRNSQYPCAAHSRLWVVSVMSCNELPGVWTHADTTSQPRPEGAGCGGNIDAAADKTTASVRLCVREWEGECVCVWKDFTRLLTDMFIPVDQCQPHCHGDNHHGNSCVTFIRASRNSLRETLCCFHDAGTSAGLMKGSLLCFYSLLTERSTRSRKEELG